MKEILKEIFSNVVEGDSAAVQQQVQSALESGIGPGVILNEALVPAMAEVGRLYEVGEYFVPEMLISARAMKSAMIYLKPALQKGEVPYVGKVVSGTVKGDLHDIGKNLVSFMLEGAGFQVRDLGTDVSAEQFIAAVRETNADIVVLSALLSTTMTSMVSTIEAIHAAGLKGKVKIMVGGAPVTEAFAKQIGADGYAPDANQAVGVARMLVADIEIPPPND
jgi:5-methyltetrahydrofolate--homocysteine methyltransferase